MLLLFAWLNLLVQPCVAGLPARPVAAEHCDHRNSPDHTESCVAMQASVCEVSSDLNAGLPHAATSVRAGALLTVLPVDAGAPGPNAAMADSQPVRATGPPLSIRYCNLRN